MVSYICFFWKPAYLAENQKLCQTHKLHIFATSLKGRIVTRKEVVDFGNCLVSSFQYKNFLICNPFDCDLHLQLLPNAEKGNPLFVVNLQSDLLDKHSLKLIENSHEIPARSKKHIKVGMLLKEGGDSSDDLKYRLSYDPMTEERHLCQVIGHGMVQSVQVVGVNSLGMIHHRIKRIITM